MSAFYNEIEPFAARWLSNLAAANQIAPGVVETRSIEALNESDLRGHNQAHFFAGIGVWSYALRLAGWPDSEPVWTGSCPCQPFSTAGARTGTDDPRHLWPAWFRLIRECAPTIVFGEQVAGTDGLAWFDRVRSDLEGSGYAVGGFNLSAAGVGAPHIRQRIYFSAIRMADPNDFGRVVECATRLHENRERGDNASRRGPAGHWERAEWRECRDGKQRPVEPGTFPMADGAPTTVGKLRAYGNAVVADLAAVFIRATADYLISLR